jgi:hypothetical protein
MKGQKGELTMRAGFEVADEDGQQLTLRVAAIGQLFALAADAAILSTFAAEKEETPEDVLLKKDFWNSSLHMSPLIVSWKNCMTIFVQESTTLALRRGWV